MVMGRRMYVELNLVARFDLERGDVVLGYEGGDEDKAKYSTWFASCGALHLAETVGSCSYGAAAAGVRYKHELFFGI
jgi:hypothetical protein